MSVRQWPTLFWIIALTLSQAMADSATVVIDDETSLQLEPYLQSWLPDKPVSFEQVLEADRRGDFRPKSKRALPATNRDVWYRFELQAPPPFNATLVLNFHELMFDELELYYQLDGSWQQIRAGLDQKNIQRPLDYRFFAVPLKVDPATPSSVYFRVRSFAPVFIVPSLETYKPFFASAIQQTTLSVSILGVLAGLIFYSWNLARVLLQPAQQFAFVGLLLSSFLYIFFADGHLSHLIDHWPELTAHAYLVTISLLNIFHLLYCRYGLELRKHSLLLDTINRLAIAVILIAVGYSLFFGTEAVSDVTLKTTTITFILMLVISLFTLRKKQQGSGYYLAAVISFFLITLYKLLVADGSIDYTPHFRVYNYIGSLSFIFILSLSVTRQLAMARKDQLTLERKAFEAEARDSTKGLFISTLSDEIRTPVNSILGMARLLKESRLDSMQTQYIDVLLDSSKSLQNTVDDFLDLSNVEANRLQLEHVFFNLDQLLVYTITAISSLNKNKPIKFDIEEIHPLPFYVKGDPTRLQQILKNLLTNALKVTERGSIVLKATQMDSDGTTATIKFSIIDSGPGVTQEDLARMLHMAGQQDLAVSGGETNLGLAVCSRLVHLMKGEIGAVNHPGSGNEIWFTVPLALDIEHQRQFQNAITKLNSTRLAVVLGNPIFSRGLIGFFHHHHIPLQILDYDTPIDSIDFRNFDILLLSNAIGEYTRAWLEQAQRHELQILLFNNINNNVLSIAEIKNLDIGVINPPYGVSQVLEVLEKLLSPRRGQQADHRFTRFNNERAGLQVMVAEDNSVSAKVIQAMLDSCDVQADYVNNGAEAVALYRQAKGNYDLILMDCEMPEMDGYEATRKIREFETRNSLAATVIVALTAHTTEDTKIQCMQTGMNSVIFKPMQKSALIELLDSLRI